MNNLGPETDIQTEENREKSSESSIYSKGKQNGVLVYAAKISAASAICNTAVQQRPQGHRVGTVTMACALIAVGVLLIIGSFNQSISFLMMARLAPIILIVLGIEILFRYFVSKGENFDMIF